MLEDVAPIHTPLARRQWDKEGSLLLQVMVPFCGRLNALGILSLIGESVRCIARGEIKLCQEPCNIHDEVNKGLLSLSVLQIHVYGISLGHARELRRMSHWDDLI